MIGKGSKFVKIKELDVIRLNDGREATVLEIFKDGEAYLIEVSDKDGEALDISVVKSCDVAEIIWAS